MKIARLFLLSILLSYFTSAEAQTILNPGDVAIIGVNCDDPDDFAFLVTVDIPAGTEIRFTDKGVDSCGVLRKYEGVLVYVAPGDLCAGDIIVYSKHTDDFSEEGPFALAADGDQLIAYQVVGGKNKFIYGVNIEGDAIWQDDATSSNTSALPPGLENGYTAVAVKEYDNVKYNGDTNFPSRSTALSTISNKDNWVGDNSSRYDFGSFNDFSLPVIISAIYGRFQSGVVKLFWETEAEPDLMGFNIYRASGGNPESFHRINKIPVEARGSGTVGARYAYTDYDVTRGVRYLYKVGVLSLSGSEVKSSPVEVSTEVCMPEGSFHIEAIYPNPANTQFVIFLSVWKEERLEIALYDCSGRKVYSIPPRLFPEGYHKIIFPVRGNLPSGVYFCRINGPDRHARTKKVIYIK